MGMTVDAQTLTAIRLEVLRQAIDLSQVPGADQVAAALGLDEADVVTAYRALSDGHVYVLEAGDETRLRMANPFSAIPTPFVVGAGGRRYFGNCVWDALGIVSVLGGEGRVETACPDCGQKLFLEVSGRQLVRGEGVVHFSVPARHWWDDIIFS